MGFIFSPIGLVVVVVSILGGYLLEGGNLHLLWQPAELVIIGGAAVGAFLTSGTPEICIGTLKAAKHALLYSPNEKKDYIEMILVLNQIFTKIRKEGAIKLEGDMDEPEHSKIFSESLKRL